MEDEGKEEQEAELEVPPAPAVTPAAADGVPPPEPGASGAAEEAAKPPRIQLTPGQREIIARNREAALKRLAERRRQRNTIDLTGDDDGDNGGGGVGNGGGEGASGKAGAKPDPPPATPRAAPEPARPGLAVGLEWDSDEVCEACGAGGLMEPDYVKAFKVQICSDCRFGDPAYELVNKTAAVSEYLLPPSELHVLPYLEKSNPRHAGFQAMKLYLRRQVKAAAVERWGSEAGIREEARRREREKYNRARDKASRALKRQRWS